MHDHGESDSLVVPAKPSNSVGAVPAAEMVEERRLAKGNTESKTGAGRSAGKHTYSALDGVRRIAATDKDAKFTALMHHINIDRLKAAYKAINPKAATGVDEVTWTDYGENLEENLQDLHRRVQSGAYRAKPTRRVHIPKANGSLRPLGIAALEDKIVQKATVEVLNAIYEKDFVGFSYGFRPGRSPHDALDALAAGIYKKKVNWVLDADIAAFFDSIDRVADHRNSPLLTTEIPQLSGGVKSVSEL